MKRSLDERLLRRQGFGLRLLLTLVSTMAATGAIQYLVTSNDTERRLLEEATRRANADVIFVQQAFDSAGNGERRIREINDRLGAINSRPGMRYVFLLDRYGVVVAASSAGVIGAYHGGPELRQVVSSGSASADLVDTTGGPNFRYIVPVELPTGRFALQMEQDASVVQGELSDLQQSTLVIVMGGSAIGIVLFFLFGGKSLADMHARALRLSGKDGLTGLGNHRTFQETLDNAVGPSTRQEGTVSLALLDIDDFKLVNDRLGHRHGDELLQKAATLLDTGRPGDGAFRIGGDEFAVVLPNTDQRAAWAVCENLWRKLVTELNGVTVSVGVATLEADMDYTDLHEHADVALYEAKRRGRNAIVSFEEMGDTAVVPAEKVRAVRKLLETGELGTAFQPIWDLQAGRPLGFEALARPTAGSGVAGAAELFQIAEMIGRTAELDILSWRCAIERAGDLPDDAMLFLNVSPFTADHGDAPIDRLFEIVDQSSLTPDRVVVELTETWSGRRDIVIEQAERLRTRGFRLALDDVGAGSGDLEMMARLPVDFLKIDLNVVQGAVTDNTSRGVLFAITAFAAHSGSFVIAEGIEDAAALDFINGGAGHPSPPANVRGGQGFFLGMPREGTPSVHQCLLNLNNPEPLVEDAR